MSLDYAILGFLSKAPQSGYDLKKQFDQTVQHFWTADQSQIYRVLSRLRKKELVTQEIIEQEDRPDRKIYHITEKGQEELAAWLKSEVPFPPMRYGPMIQVYFGACLSDEELLKIFERQSNGIRQKMMSLREHAPTLLGPQENETERDAYMRRLTFEASMRQAQTRLAFADEVMERIKNGDVPKHEFDC